MLTDLREERDQIDEAIMTLERLALGRGRRRGRPPAWLTELRKSPETKPAGKGKTSAQSGD